MLRTAECVSPKHPDKVCDRISDAILDACLEQDPDSRVAVETMGGHGIVTVTGEITSKAYVDIRKIVRRIAGDNVGIQINVVEQSPEIAQGVDTGGAGDQGIMVGYATNENHLKIPQELFLARSLCRYLYEYQPEDGKTQVTLEGNEIKTIVVSWANMEKEKLLYLIRDWFYENGFRSFDDKEVHANPAGDWNISGFEADTGLTGRKLACDNYGPAIPIGGGAFSGKDGSKVDRSAAYMARYIAVKALHDLFEPEEHAEVLVKIAYAIGVAKPVMVTVKSRKHDEEAWSVVDWRSIIEEESLKPKAIIEFLKLKEPEFERTADWGSMGNGFLWDNII